MRDLPEVETTRRDLDREVVGKKVKLAEVHIAKSLGAAAGKARFLAAVDGAKITKVTRCSRRLILETDTGKSIVIFLGIGGLLLKTTPRAELHKRTAWSIGFTQGGRLRMIDHKADASTTVVDTETRTEEIPELAKVGIDPVDEPMSWTAFGHHLLRFDGKLKAVLTDETIIAGVGPMYADEILFDAGLRYDREVTSLNAQEIRRLYRALVEILHDAMKYRGTSLEEDTFLDLYGNPGTYQQHLQVYDKAGQLSPRSRRPIAKVKFAGEWTYFCEQSQV